MFDWILNAPLDFRLLERLLEIIKIVNASSNFTLKHYNKVISFAKANDDIVLSYLLLTLNTVHSKRGEHLFNKFIYIPWTQEVN